MSAIMPKSGTMILVECEVNDDTQGGGMIGVVFRHNDRIWNVSVPVHCVRETNPAEVRGRIDWHHGKAYLGPFLCGEVVCCLSDPPKFSVRTDDDIEDVPGFFPTEAAARAALVAAVREAIETQQETT